MQSHALPAPDQGAEISRMEYRPHDRQECFQQSEHSFMATWLHGLSALWRFAHYAPNAQVFWKSLSRISYYWTMSAQAYQEIGAKWDKHADVHCERSVEVVTS